MNLKPFFYLLILIFMVFTNVWSVSLCAERDDRLEREPPQVQPRYYPEQLNDPELFRKPTDQEQTEFYLEHYKKYRPENMPYYTHSSKVKVFVASDLIILLFFISNTPYHRIDNIVVCFPAVCAFAILFYSMSILRFNFMKQKQDALEKFGNRFHPPTVELHEAKLMVEALDGFDFKKYLPEAGAPVLNDANEGLQRVFGNFLVKRSELVRRGVLRPLTSERQMFDVFAQWRIIRSKDADVYFNALFLKQRPDG